MGFCPFCEGNEDKTPPEILADRLPGSLANGPGWTIRIVSNKFAALRIEGELGQEGVGMFDRMNGVGAHEVVIETPRHDLNLLDLEQIHVEKLIQAYRKRLIDLMKDQRFRYVLIFKNYGATAGASLPHPHTQVISYPGHTKDRGPGTRCGPGALYLERALPLLRCDPPGEWIRESVSFMMTVSSWQLPLMPQGSPSKSSCHLGTTNTILVIFPRNRFEVFPAHLRMSSVG